ncbi:double zinc ribbon domain-containing protein [Natrononativus amylolyticus]|uniref:double zinc ribbon domain-containing protein n=1 Tax=Natrononativus amylolyticus TaxID=2963434 RepID=UPI0020CF3439|nr:zinc ribbon domain-containing protein [Natrononativus amylolyticus]
MSKITFRADDDLVAELEAFDASKSEVMREALRTYLESHRDPTRRPSTGDRRPVGSRSIDDLVRERVDAVLAERHAVDRPRHGPQDVNVTVSLEGVDGQATTPSPERRGQPRAEADRDPTEPDEPTARPESACGQCGEHVDDDHVYCPNCGEKASRRLFCDCGDEVRSDWAFCPSCGRRTPAADVLESDRR